MTSQPIFVKPGDMVVCHDGRIGLLTTFRHPPAQSLIQFGPSGPSKLYRTSGLRRATGQEIIDAGLDGVGCNQAREVVSARHRIVEEPKCLDN